MRIELKISFLFCFFWGIWGIFFEEFIDTFREARWAVEISADDIFLGVIDSMELIMPLDQTFFAVVGMQNIQHLQKHISTIKGYNNLFFNFFIFRTTHIWYPI